VLLLILQEVPVNVDIVYQKRGQRKSFF